MSLNYNWRIGGIRSQNVIEAHHQRLESATGTRWALGRNVKISTGWRTYGSVEVWTLKHRVEGKAVTVETGRSREQAEAWVASQ